MVVVDVNSGAVVGGMGTFTPAVTLDIARGQGYASSNQPGRALRLPAP